MIGSNRTAAEGLSGLDRSITFKYSVSFFCFVCSRIFDFLDFCHRNCLSDSQCHFNIAFRKCFFCPITFV